MSDEKEATGSLIDQLRSLGGIYWIANWMELVERFAYYGVRTVLPVFMVLAISEGGPELTHVQKGTIYAIWALVQSFVPIFSGVYSDRYGYKLSIAIATALKIVGYLVMGYCIAIAEGVSGMPLAEARPAGLDHTYEIFFAGAMLLALGTAVFKPGVQGLIATRMPEESASLGWGVFYQMVNIGGFIGPLVAAYLQVLAWEHVFVTCAVAIAFNFVPLFFFASQNDKEDDRSIAILSQDALRGLLDAKLFFFSISFAGFWLMFYQLFDILPNFIDDWVDSRSVVSSLQAVLSWEGAVPTVADGNLNQAWMINVNAGLISLFAFLVGYWTGKMRALVAITVGIAIAAAGIYALGISMSGWVILGAIGFFSIGEMLASPTKMRYVASLAPPGRKGQYMGYVNMTVGIGWSIGSIVAGHWYEEGGDKINLARRYLTEHLGQDASGVAALERSEVLPRLMEATQLDPWAARDLLWDAYNPSAMWLWFTLIGLGSMGAIILYDRILTKAKADPQHSFNTRGRTWVRAAVVPLLAILSVATVMQFQGLLGEGKTIGEAALSSLGLGANTVLMGIVAIASFVLPEERSGQEPSEL